LDAAATLARITAERRVQDEAAAAELRAVTHWADLHRVDRVDGSEGGPAGIGAVDPTLRGLFPADRPVLGMEGQLRLAGEGAFTVAEFAVCELAAALGLSETAARAYLGQGLELRDRLPRCWAAVLAGELPAWKARQIAAETLPLTAAAADYVDRHLARFAHAMSLRRILRAVRAAILRFDPAAAADRAKRASDGRGGCGWSTTWTGPPRSPRSRTLRTPPRSTPP
jgi:hypothetical protein